MDPAVSAIRGALVQLTVWMTAAPRAATALAVLRIVVGVLALVYYLRDYGQRHLFFGPDGVYGSAAVAATTRELGTFNLYSLSDSPVYFEVVFHAAILAAAAVTIGFGGRWAIAVHYVLLWSTYGQNPALLDGGDNLQMIVVPALVLTECTSRLGVHIRPRVNTPGLVRSTLHNTGLLLIAGQICVVYLMSGLYKVQGPLWQDGTALYSILRVPDFYFPGVTELLFASDTLLVLGAYGTVLSSIAFPVLIIFRRGRLPAVLMMTAFHLSIAFFMGLTAFAAIMVACDLVFASGHVERVLVRARSSIGPLRFRPSRVRGSTPVPDTTRSGVRA
jgi:hypothetical protein